VTRVPGVETSSCTSENSFGRCHSEEAVRATEVGRTICLTLANMRVPCVDMEEPRALEVVWKRGTRDPGVQRGAHSEFAGEYGEIVIRAAPH
jgi:hypothetical protein